MAKKRSRDSRTGQSTRQGFISTKLEPTDVPDYVVVELRYESPIAATASGFVAPEAANRRQAEQLNAVLEGFDIRAVRSHFGLKAADVRARVAVAEKLPPEPDPDRFRRRGMDTSFIQSGFVQVIPKKGSDAKSIAARLNSKPAVWKAYVAPRPVPA